jgi:iron complex outermembrane receptor protein
MRRMRPTVLAAVLAITCLQIAAQPVGATPPISASTSQAYNLPAGPLGSTLLQIAQQRGQPISVQPELVRGLQAPAIHGQFTAEQAAAAALAASPLDLIRTANGTLSVRMRPGSDASSAATGPSLAAVTVTASAERETAWGPVPGYVAKRSATGTKTDTPLIETPQSISVVTAREIEATKAQSLTDALAYTAGVFRSEGNDRTADRLYIRGFNADAIEGSLYRDGTKYMVNAFNGRQEPYGLERIEVLKGAASVLYGSAAPGGIINTVSKRPSATLLREVNVEVGNQDRKQVSMDLGGAITEDGVWTYRLTALQRDSGSFVDYVPDDRSYIAPALKWQPSAQTSLTLLSHYQHSRTKYVFGFPAEGTVLPNPNGSIPINRYLGEPDRDRAVSTNQYIGYLFEHAFSDSLKLRNNVSYFKAESNMPATWPLTGTYEDAAMRSIPRFAESQRNDASSALAFDVSLEYQWNLGNTSNTLLVGADTTSQRHQSERWLNMPASLDVFAPVYGIPYEGTEVPRGYPASRKTHANLTGIYLQNQTKIDQRWVLLLGGRQDWARNASSPFFGAEEWANENSHAFSGRAGLVYLADNGLAPFVSWSESFQPQDGSNRAGTRFDPTTGNQYELGLRYQPKNSNTLLTAALYQLTRQNVTTTDPVDNAYQVQTGEVRSRGLELEAKVDATRALSLVAAYAYTDARTTQSNIPEEVGKRTGAVPRHQLSMWADYGLQSWGLPGLRAGAGVRYVGSTVGTYINVQVPAFTLFDAMLGYETGPWRLALNVTNIADKVHVTNCIDVCYYGEPRKVVATASYRW